MDELTDEQRERTERNRLAALERRRSKLPVSDVISGNSSKNTVSDTRNESTLETQLVDGATETLFCSEKHSINVASCWINRDSSTCHRPDDIIDPARVKLLNDKALIGDQPFVLLWISNDVREACNPALEYAIASANSLQLPLVAMYGLWEKFPEANERMFAFLIQAK
jgi:hypothetical protein